jgi:hypothetical protein
MASKKPCHSWHMFGISDIEIGPLTPCCYVANHIFYVMTKINRLRVDTNVMLAWPIHMQITIFDMI